jgi:hypothetical protein
MSESDERHQQDAFQNEDEPDVEAHVHDTFGRTDEAAEVERTDEASERHRTDEAM